MDLVISLVSFAFVIGIVVAAHEFGHFLAAKMFGVAVPAFSIGFGPVLARVRRGETEYRLSVIPLGGYVLLAGDDKIPGQPDADPSRRLTAKPRWQQFIIFAAGPLASVLFGIVLTASVYLAAGRPITSLGDLAPNVGYVEPDSPLDDAGIRPGDKILSVNGDTVQAWDDIALNFQMAKDTALEIVVQRDTSRITSTVVFSDKPQNRVESSGALPGTPIVVGRVLPGSPAERAGLKSGDRLLAFDGQRLFGLPDAQQYIAAHAGSGMAVLIERGADTLLLSVTPADEAGVGKMGISFSLVEDVGPLHAVKEGFRDNVGFLAMQVAAFKKIFRGEASARENLSGPIGIISISGQIARVGIASLLLFAASLSTLLGVINLLPIPAMDGGRMLIVSVEMAIRRDIPPKAKNALIGWSFALLIILMAAIIINDISKLF